MTRDFRGLGAKSIVFLTLLIGLSVAVVTLPVTDYILACVRWVSALGTVGMALFALLYFVAGLVMLPMLPIGVLAGMAYGFTTGFLILLPTALASAVLATLLGRTVFRETVDRYVSRRPRWQAVCEAMSSQGIRAVMLNRLAPVLPFGLQNYALGAVGVSLKSQLFGTLIGMQPALWVALYLGAAVTDFAHAKAQFGMSMYSGPRVYLLIGGGVALLLLVLWLGRVAHRATMDQKS
jgi:uncharacterized membrane protein YdjX (TVP38/TMEM64 family)